VLALGFGYMRLTANLENGVLPFLFKPVRDAAALWPIFGSLLVLGCLISTLGSLLSVRKYLREVRRIA